MDAHTTEIHRILSITNKLDGSELTVQEEPSNIEVKLYNQEETEIIATEQNKELISIFFKANNIPNIEVGEYRRIIATFNDNELEYIITEKAFMAISIKYLCDDPTTEILLLNLVIKHSGLNYMLIDYLRKVKSFPIVVKNNLYVKSASDDECTSHFLTNVAPWLEKTQNKKSILRKKYTVTEK